MQKRNIKNIILLALCTMLAACQNAPQQKIKKGNCRIHGVMESDKWNGKYIFLVPLEGVRDSLTVDSLVIENREFEFVVDTCEMKILRVDYHFRQGLQDLLVVSEPGNVEVFLGSISSGGGTPQNDSMQVWKSRKDKFSADYDRLRKQNKKHDSLKIIQRESKAFTRDVAERMSPGVFKDFLNARYPAHKDKKTE